MTTLPLALRHGLAVDFALLVISFKRRAAYRTQWLVGSLVSGTELLTALALWSAVLAERGQVGGYDWDAMRTYYVIAFVTAAVAFGGTEGIAAQRILDGMVAIDLLKPVDFQRARAAEYTGSILGNLPTLGIGLTVSALFLDPLPPASFAAGALSVASVLLIIPLAFGLMFLSIMLCFWTRSYHGVLWSRRTITAFFSGAMIPLALMPDAVQAVAAWLPFVHITTTPSNIYLGRVDTMEAIGLVALEVAWCVALWLLGRVLWSRAVKVVTVHGG
ncbi:MAG TPA: ABC-2 family transporter protein [Glycomyces sp.]|nr:ABC-2 family transporter protein [Glycomyces sp.]